MHHDVGGAVCCERVVPDRLLLHGIDLLDILHKELPCPVTGHPGSIEVNVLLGIAVVCSYPYKVTLIAGYIDQLILFKEPLDGGVPFPFLLACFNGKGYEVFLLETEADHDVGYGITHPVDGDDVHGIKAVQIEGLVVVIHVKISFCAIVEVTDVVDGNKVVLDGGIGKNSHIGLPVTGVGGLDVEPPHNNQAEDCQKTDDSPEPLFEQKKCCCCAYGKTNGYGGPNPSPERCE